MCRAQRLILIYRPNLRFSSTLDDNADGSPEHHHSSINHLEWKGSVKRGYARRGEPEHPNPVVKHRNRLTSGLAQCHSVYRHGWYMGKKNLGRSHPLALKIRQEAFLRPETTPCRPRGTRSPTAPKAKRFRVKLSSELADYMQSVAAWSISDSHDHAVGNLTPTGAGASISAPSAQSSTHAQTALSTHELNTSSGSGPFAKSSKTLQELELLKQRANHHSKIMTPESLRRLAFRRIGVQDLAAWNWILTAKTAEDAALRFEALLKPPEPYAGDFSPVPTFVFLRVLYRTDISLRALKLLIDQAWQILGFIDQPQEGTDPETMLQSTSTRKPLESMGLDALVILVDRLLRHARQVWPASCVRITQLWIAHAKPGRVVRMEAQGEVAEKDTMRLSFCYNRILSLLSLPPNPSPYQSLHYRQRAQFMVIRQMNTLNPPLTINREGYRGVVQVQLAHRKTHEERIWARLKGKSWPPWKEDKLGVDAFVGIEQGISRASNSRRQMVEAGYGLSDWDKAAGILAGWDTDHSPTVQKRSALVPDSLSPPSSDEQKETSGVPDADGLWVARIQATRTLQEAWIAFLACKNQGTPLSPEIYHAILEKIVYDEKRHQPRTRGDVHCSVQTEDKLSLAGDGKEVEESSSSHNQVILTREQIPTFDEMLSQVISDHVRPSGRFLAFLLSHTRTYSQGIQILHASRLHESVKKVLIPQRAKSFVDVPRLFETLPHWLFASYVDFFCRFAYKPKGALPQLHEGYSALDSVARDGRGPLLLLKYATKLVAICKPFYRPPWNSLLGLLARRETVVALKISPYAQAIPKFHDASRLLRRMDSIGLDMDFTGFGSLLVITANAFELAKATLSTSNDDEHKAMAQALLDEGLSLVKAHFSQLVQPVESIQANQDPSDDASSDDPRTLADPSQGSSSTSTVSQIPHPAHLHAYIRFLGQYPDYDGLADLVSWMSAFSDQIMEEAKETANGVARMRTCIVAARAFLEQPLTEDDAAKRERVEHHIDNIRLTVESNEFWDGWPSDEEVEQYFSIGEQHLGNLDDEIEQ
ncbi:MAG: hypothetical protein Q9208_002862 [Pyrenodesmia sp. 3 TL-2023]